MNWRMLFTPGILIIGDHVSVPPEYWKHILGTWDRFEHGGTANANLSDSPYFVMLGLLATIVGAGFADKALIVSFFVISILAATGLLVRAFRSPMVPSFALGVFYTFNPWTAARLAAGHTQILMACATLPLILLVWRAASARAVLLAAVGVAVEMCLNLQVALLVLVALIAFGGPRRSFFVSARDAAICLALAAGMSFWWILPLLGTHGGNAGHTGLENILSYTQRTDVVHTATLRSYWWPAFSDGLYRYGTLAGTLVVYLGMAAILAIEFAILVSWRWLSSAGKVGVALWAAVSCVLVGAHLFPIAYYELLRLPFATLYRDPDKLVPLALIGMVLAGGDVLSRLNWKNRVGIPIACVAIACITVPWWSSGSLRGNVQPQTVRDGSLQAADWLAGQKGADLVLWWPVGPYIRYRWYPAGGQDPMRYWSRNPMLNPYYDPAYDASPETSDFLNSLEANVPRGKMPFLGGVLGTYGIRYVAVRNYASTSFTSFPNWRSSFDDVRDLRRIRSFGDTDVYENVDWRPARDIIGHYDAMITGDFVTMLSLDPGLESNEMLTGDGDPTKTSYEYMDIDRQLERGLVTYRYESSSPYEVVFPTGAAPEQSFTNLPVSCATCDVLLVRTNAVAPHIEVNELPASPPLLYLDLPAWKPRWRAFAVGNASTISIITGDRNAYVYDAVMVSHQALNAAMLRSFDEVRHHWPTYLADADGLDMRPEGPATIGSDRLGPIVETDSRKWRASVVGTGLSRLSLIFYWWSGGERQRTVDLACNPTLCTGSVDLSRGFQRVSLRSARGATVIGFMMTSGKPPLFDNSRVDAIPGQMDATTKLLVPSSHNVGWHLACVNAAVEPTIGNRWATLYATGRVVVDCAARYGPDALERAGVVISLLTLSATALALLIPRRLRLRSRELSPEDAVETQLQ
jgi:hypothetical protein